MDIERLEKNQGAVDPYCLGARAASIQGQSLENHGIDPSAGVIFKGVCLPLFFQD
jgi:hypothetical protein